MSSPRRFSSLKKQIESLFVPELNMQFCCQSFRIGRNSYPRFYVKLGKEIIWEAPKDFSELKEFVQAWAPDNNICELIREYIDTPKDELLNKTFENDSYRTFINYISLDGLYNPKNLTIDVEYGLADIFKAADRRVGKEKLFKWASRLNNETINMIIKKRFK